MDRVLRALAWLLVITVVAAQSECLSLTSQFPSCVAGCVTSGAKSAGCTNTLDLSSIQAYAIGCATSACHGNAASMLDGLKVGSSVCNCVASVASERLRLVPATDNSTASPVAQPQLGCGSGPGDDGKVASGYGDTWSPSPSDEELPYTLGTADAASPAQTPCDGQDFDWCEEPKVVTIIHTITKVSTWTPPVYRPTNTSSYGVDSGGLDAGVELNGERIRVRAASHQPVSGEEEREVEADSSECAQELAPAAENCTALATKVVPICAQECFKAKASKVGCEVLDLACQCRDDIQAQLTTLMMPCVLSACEMGEIFSVVAAGTSVCSCVSATGRAQAIWEGQEDAGEMAPTPSPGQATPGSEPEQMAKTSTTTTCVVVTPPAEDCAIYRPTFAPCGSDCLAPVVPEAGCDIDDFLCQCAPDKQAALSTLVLPCVRESCSESTRADVMWDPEAMCACASRATTSTTCYATGVSASTTSSPALTKTSSTKGTTTASLQNAAAKYGIEILVGIVMAVFVAGMAL